MPRICWALGLWLIAMPASAALSPVQYRAALAAAVADARRAAASAAPAEATTLLRQARGRFPASVTVTGADGLPVRVSDRTMARLLDRAIGARSAAARQEAIRGFVRAGELLQSAVTGPAPTRTPRDGQALRQILARSEFSQTPLERWDQRVREWLMERLRSLFRGVRPAALQTIAFVVYYGFLALLVLLLAYLIWTYVPGLRLRRLGRAARLSADGTVVAPESAAAHLAAADAAAAAGRYLDALRHAYTAMLLRLDAAGLVAFDRARTNWEVLRALQRAGNTTVRDLFQPVTLALDEKLYGGRPATEEDYRGCRAAALRLEALLASASLPPAGRRAS
jgi:hypothetical protein